jgi:hypothetical protein
MLWAITGITFLATVGILVALLYAFSAGEEGVGRRLSRVLDTSVSTQQGAFSQKSTDRARVWLASIGGLFPSSSGQASRSQLMMIRAGIRRPDAMLAMRGIKLLMPVAFVATAIFSGIYKTNPFFILIVAAFVRASTSFAADWPTGSICSLSAWKQAWDSTRRSCAYLKS